MNKRCPSVILAALARLASEENYSVYCTSVLLRSPVELVAGLSSCDYFVKRGLRCVVGLVFFFFSATLLADDAVEFDGQVLPILKDRLIGPVDSVYRGL